MAISVATASPASRPRKKCWSMWPGLNANIRVAGRTWVTPASGSSSAPAGTAARRLNGTFTEAHILAITQAICDYRRAHGNRRPALHGQGHTRAVRPGPANGARGAGRQRRRDGHPARGRGHADAGHLAGDTRPQPRAEGHLADGIVITPSHNPPEDGGFKYNPPTAALPTPKSPGGSQDRANELLRAETPKSSACLREGDQGSHDSPGGFRPALCQRPAERHRHGGNSRRRTEAGGRPARRRSGALLGADKRQSMDSISCRQSNGRSDFFIHDRRSRRQNSHGLLEPLCHGAPGRSKGSVSRRLRQRSRTPTGMASSRPPPG